MLPSDKYKNFPSPQANENLNHNKLSQPSFLVYYVIIKHMKSDRQNGQF